MPISRSNSCLSRIPSESSSPWSPLSSQSDSTIRGRTNSLGQRMGLPRSYSPDRFSAFGASHGVRDPVQGRTDLLRRKSLNGKAVTQQKSSSTDRLNFLGRLNDIFSREASSSLNKSRPMIDGVEVELLGKGAFGIVYRDPKNSHRVIKRSCRGPVAYGENNDFENEWEIGQSVKSLKHCVKVREFRSNYYPAECESSKSKQVEHEITMDLVKGTTLNNLLFNSIDSKKMSSLIPQVLNTALQLFDLKIAWADLNLSNVFLSKEDQLIFIDFGGWSKCEDPTKRAQEILDQLKWFIPYILTKCDDSPFKEKVSAKLRSLECEQIKSPQALKTFVDQLQKVLGNE